MQAQLFVGNDQTLKLTGTLNERTGAYINNATVTATLKTMAGVEVAGQSWPTTLIYETGSDGDYLGNLDDALSLVNNKRYIVEITADGGSGLKGFWRFTVTARYRTPDC